MGQGVLVVFVTMTGLGTADAHRPSQPVPVRRELANGLVVAALEIPTASMATVDVLYRAGSGYDPPGRPGLAHLTEHMMFARLAKDAGGYRQQIHAVGGTYGAITTTDYTRYTASVPARHLGLALSLEAERMAAVEARVTPEGLESQRSVVKSELRQRRMGTAFGDRYSIMMAGLFPAGHRYHGAPIGTIAGIDAVTLEDVHAMMRMHYHTGNAIVTVSGNIVAADAIDLVERHFGSIPRRSSVKQSDPAPPTNVSERHVVYEDAGAAGRSLIIAWPGPGAAHPDRAAVAMLARALGTMHSGMLRDALALPGGPASQVFAVHNEMLAASIIQVEATPVAGESLASLLGRIDTLVAGLKERPVDDGTLARLRDNPQPRADDHQRMAHLLGLAELYHGDARMALRLESLETLTALDLRQAAARYLGARRLVISMVPAGKAGEAARVHRPDVHPDNDLHPR